ncbi:hypothetical protein [Aquilutibacter rugosus]|uniref:hypothetical protein n=1 Tax=Aquilutibacter rugosus TaxID=3115820 RepID=UPI002F3F0F4A
MSEPLVTELIETLALNTEALRITSRSLEQVVDRLGEVLELIEIEQAQDPEQDPEQDEDQQGVRYYDAE